LRILRYTRLTKINIKERRERREKCDPEGALPMIGSSKLPPLAARTMDVPSLGSPAPVSSTTILEDGVWYWTFEDEENYRKFVEN
jgi:hypothetical protein